MVKNALIFSQSDSIPPPRKTPLIGHLFVLILLVTFPAKVAEHRNTRTTDSQANPQHSSTVQPALSQ